MRTPGIILASLLLFIFSSDQALFAASENFKDEAGRTIYTVDSDGTVTMYEKGPGDQTISISTGTREQMQPQITEVSPEKVTSGSFIILKLFGKNLVGAKVTFSVPGMELNPYSPKPDSVELPIRVPATVPAGEVVVELTTPIGSTRATFKVTELQLGSTSARREQQTFTRAAPSSCPQGMVGVGYELGGFCIDVDRSVSGDYRKVEKTCAAKGRRLCQAPEWQHACEQTKSGKLALQNVPGEWEWTGSWESTDSPVEEVALLQNIVVGKTDCQTREAISSGKAASFAGRCCR
jgi:hypothetical protein